MKPASINDLKKELKELPPEELAKLCIRLAGYKKENKELLTYLIFEAVDEQAYIRSIKTDVEEEFQSINKTTLYFAKKTIRRILRMVKKYIKYSGKKETEVDLLIFFLQTLKETEIPIQDSKVLVNLYERQLITIRKAMVSLHEDLQYDYEETITSLELQ